LASPDRPLVAGGFHASGKPTLRILNHDLAYSAQFPRAHDLPGFLDQRVPGVIVGESKEKTGLVNEGLQAFRLVQAVGQRFIAHHRKTGLQRQTDKTKMQMVGNDDGNEIHALVFR
jgi:hypothetical protein